MGFTRAID